MNDATEHHAEEEEKTYEKATIVYERDINSFHTAITSLFYAMSQTMSTSKMAETFGVSRNWLMLVFSSYKHNLDMMPKMLESNLPYVNRPYLFSEDSKQLHWKLDTLVVAAQVLKMPVSDIIRAAEDVQEGLPPWFQYRISKASTPHYKLMCIFYEALEYYEYNFLNPLEQITQKAKKRSHVVLNQEENPQTINTIVDSLIGNCKETGLIDAYNNQEISCNDVYKVLKRSFDFFKRKGGDSLSFHLKTSTQYDLVLTIRNEFRRCLSERKTTSSLTKNINEK